MPEISRILEGMMRVISAIVLAVCSMGLFCQAAFAEKRIALMIGNSAYERAPRLLNPVNDAVAMSEMFKSAGFDTVQLMLDAKAGEMRRALRNFSDEARDADIAIIYFAGHGIEIGGTNYLVPVDAVLERDIDAYDEAISLDRLLDVIEPARQLRLIILDACRDNPFAKSMKQAVVSRAVTRGLAKVDPVSPNTLIAFAAKAGSTAADGNTKNSPFTEALVKYLPQPGLDLRRAFGYVRDDVLKVTRNRQEPFIYGSLGGDDFALVAAPTVAPPPAPVVDANATARADYELALQINVVSAWDSYIKKYPAGFYSDLARVQRDQLIDSKAAAEQARLAAERKASDEAKAAEAERQRLAEAQAKAEQDAKLAAEKARAEDAARAAEQARHEAERQKALAEAKAVEEARQTAAKKAAEQARLAAEKKAADEAKAAENKALEEAKAAEASAAEAARPKAAQTTTQLATVLPGDGRLGQGVGQEVGQAARVEPRSAAGCAGAPQQIVSLSPDAARALSLPEECGLKPKDAFKECPHCPEMVVIPGGEFVMGSSKDEIDNELAAANEAPQHKVVVRQTIAVGRFEITRDQFAAFVDSTGYQGGGRCMTFEHNLPRERENRSFLAPGYAQDGNHPAVCVSWTDAQAYADWLSKSTGKSYRLPSEAEFEYAARAGGTARYGFTDEPADLCRFANGADQSAKTAGLPPNAPYMGCTDGYPFTAPVGSFAANAFGLHDLIGNVWEWTADCFTDNYGSAASDSAPRDQAGCTARTVRGGDWFSSAFSLRPAARAKANPDAHNDDIGFRVVRILAH
jgi:formylglycine-generating enzyme required for sulfatase activity